MREMGLGVYRDVNLLTADPQRVLLMSYELAIRSLKAAKKHYLAGEYEAKAKSLQKALDIISELDMALNFEKGGEIAENLHALYSFIRHYALQADLKRDIDAFERIITMLEEIESAWKEIIDGQKNRTAPAPPPQYATGSGVTAGSRIWSV